MASSSKNVYRIYSSGDVTSWKLEIGHRGTDTTCGLEVSSALGSDAENAIRCSTDLFIEVSKSDPEEGEEITLSATEAIARLAFESGRSGLFETLYAADPYRKCSVKPHPSGMGI